MARDTDGSLFIILELPFEEYLHGLAEVPRDWPEEALKAQAVAARTYALAQLERRGAEARRLGYDICATEACQVYRGLGVARGAWGERWVQAVEETRGEVLLYRGRPALALYFSTSDGRTRSVEEVFGGEPLPYLRGVPEEDDGASPLSHWDFRMPLDDLAEVVRRKGLWQGGRLEMVERKGGIVLLKGEGGETQLPVSRFRFALNTEAPCLDPSRYPPAGPRGKLPETLPSTWFDLRVEGRHLLVSGRGWGHGVGMVQWGARGKALRGLAYREILSRYYSETELARAPTPATIRVGVATGLEEVVIEPVGPLSSGPKTPAPWLLRAGDSPSPKTASGFPDLLRAEILSAPSEARLGGDLRVSFRVSSPAKVRVVIVPPHLPLPRQIPISRSAWASPFRPSPAGEGEARVELEAEGAGSPAAGDYFLWLEADDGVDRVRAGPLSLRILPKPFPAPGLASPRQPEASRPPRRGPDPKKLALAGGLLVALAAAAAAHRLRRPHKGTDGKVRTPKP